MFLADCPNSLFIRFSKAPQIDSNRAKVVTREDLFICIPTGVSKLKTKYAQNAA